MNQPTNEEQQLQAAALKLGLTAVQVLQEILDGTAQIVVRTDTQPTGTMIKTISLKRAAAQE